MYTGFCKDPYYQYFCKTTLELKQREKKITKTLKEKINTISIKEEEKKIAEKILDLGYITWSYKNKIRISIFDIDNYAKKKKLDPPYQKIRHCLTYPDKIVDIDAEITYNYKTKKITKIKDDDFNKYLNTFARSFFYLNKYIKLSNKDLIKNILTNYNKKKLNLLNNWYLKWGRPDIEKISPYLRKIQRVYQTKGWDGSRNKTKIHDKLKTVLNKYNFNLKKNYNHHFHYCVECLKSKMPYKKILNELNKIIK